MRDHYINSEIMKDIIKNIKNPSKCIETGYKNIDAILGGGFKGGMLYILGSRPGMDRSTLAMNMMLKIMDAGKKIAYFSFESTMEHVMTKLLLMKAKVDTEAAINPSEEDLAAIESAADEIAKSDLIVIDEVSPDIDALMEYIFTIPEYLERDVIIIDDIQFCTALNPDVLYEMTSHEDISGYVCRNLKKIAKLSNIPVIVLGQVDRKVYERYGMRPALIDLRPASGLEYYADVVMFLHRDDYYDYDKETDLKGIAEVIVAKNIWGRTGRCQLIHIPDYMRFFTPAKF